MKLNKIYSQFYKGVNPKEERGLKIYDLLERQGYDREFASGLYTARENAVELLKHILRNNT